MVLQDEAARRTGNRGSGTRQNPHRAGQSARRVFQLDAEYSRLDIVAPALVGPSHPGVVLQGAPSRYRGARNADEMRGMRLRTSHAGRRYARHVVQLGIVAFFNAGLARADS